MKRLKKYFELFDNEELKARHELDMLKGKNPVSAIKYVGAPETADDLYQKLTYAFPFFENFNDNQKGKTLSMWVKNEQWYLSILVSIEGKNQYNMGILYKSVHVHTAEPGTEAFKFNLKFTNKENTHFQEWNNNTFDGLVELIKTNFVPQMKMLMFTAELKHQREKNIRKFN
jgi:hypothetical protein